MSNPQTIQIFTTQIANGVGAICKTVERAEKVETEPVIIQIAGTWESVTVKPQISLDGGTTFNNSQVVKSDGTLADIVITADALFALNIVSGAQFTLIVSGVGGSPPDLDAWARGNIILVA